MKGLPRSIRFVRGADKNFKGGREYWVIELCAEPTIG